MNTIRISATAARNRFFELLDMVSAGTEVIIEKDKEEVALLSPRKTKTDWKALSKAIKEARGVLKDYSVEEITPTRKKGSWKRLGKWDQGLDLSKKK